MDYMRLIYRLRPDVTWIDNSVNSYSKETIKLSYISSQPFPTDQEFTAEEIVMLSEDIATEQIKTEIENEYQSTGLANITIEMVDNYLDIKFNEIDSLQSAKNILRELFGKYARVIIKLQQYIK